MIKYSVELAFLIILLMLASCVEQKNMWHRIIVYEDDSIEYIQHYKGDSPPKAISIEELQDIASSFLKNDYITVSYFCKDDSIILRKVKNVLDNENIKYLCSKVQEKGASLRKDLTSDLQTSKNINHLNPSHQ